MSLLMERVKVTENNALIKHNSHHSQLILNLDWSL